jgi:hypothetical protein
MTSRTGGGAPGGGTARPSAPIVAPQVALVRCAGEENGRHSTLFGPGAAAVGEATTANVAIATVAPIRRGLTRRG